jgi:RNA polymerase sigma-70 factor (ECF subfamily)
MATAARDRRTPPSADAAPSPSAQADASLLNAAAQGEAASIETLYGRYRDGAIAVALSVTSDEMEAEDVVQEVFEALPRMARSYDMTRGLAPQWLFRSVRNRAIDHVRRRTRQANRLVGSEVGLDAVIAGTLPATPTPAEELDAEEMLELIGRLEPRYAHLVRLAFVDGWSHSAIAGITGLPLGTVKTRIRVSLQLIRTLLNEHDVTPLPERRTDEADGWVVVFGTAPRLSARVRRAVGGLVSVVRAAAVPTALSERPALVVAACESVGEADDVITRLDDLGWSRVPVVIVGPAAPKTANVTRSGLVMHAGPRVSGGLTLATAVTAALSAARVPGLHEHATRRLLSSTRDAVITVDHLGRVIDASKAASALFDQSPRQLARRYMTELTAMPSSWTELQWHRMVTRGWWSDRSRIRRADGPPLEVHAYGWSGAGQEVVALIRSIKSPA